MRQSILVFLAGLALTAAALPSCSDEKNSQFVAGVMSQVQVPRDLRSVVLQVKLAGTFQFCKAYDVSNGIVNLPQTIGTLDNAKSGLPVEIAVIGLKTAPETVADCSTGFVVEREVRVLRRSVQTYVAGRKLYVPLPLKYACFDKDCPNPDETCKGGVCMKAEIDSSTLAEYSDDLVFGKSLCFRIEDKKDAQGKVSAPGCFSARLPPTLLDAGACRFSLPEVAGVPFSGVNVEVAFQTKGDGPLLREVLDLDKDEGFFIPDPAKPREFQLAPGLCEAFKAADTNKYTHPIVAITSSGLCASKTILQPICEEEQKVINYPQDAATASVKLPQAPSALGIIFDRSRDNKKSFEKDGLADRFINLAISAPALANTQMGLVLIPGSQSNACTVTQDSVQLSSNSREAVASKLREIIQGGETKLLDAADISNGKDLSAALEASHSDVANSTAGRKAIAFIGSGPFDKACTTNATTLPSDLATGYADNGVRTYVIVAGETTYRAQAPAFAKAGTPDHPAGDSSYDATGSTGTTTGAKAFADIAIDLGTCLYKDPVEKVPNFSGKVSFLDPITFKETIIEKSASACTLTTGEGWTRTGENIELCGKSCTKLRDVVRTQLAAAFKTGVIPQEVGVHFRK